MIVSKNGKGYMFIQLMILSLTTAIAIKLVYLYSLDFFLQKLIVLLPVPAYYINNAKKNGFANKILLRFLGAKKKIKKTEELFAFFKDSEKIKTSINRALITRNGVGTYQEIKLIGSLFCYILPIIKKNKTSNSVVIIFIQGLKKKKKKKNKDNLYFNIFNHLPYLIWIRDKNMKIKYFNTEYYKFVENRTIENSNDIIELSNECMMLARESIKNKQKISRNIHITENNTLKTLLLTEIPLKEGTIGFGHDITYSKNLEKDSLRTTDAYHNFFESLSNAISIYNSSRQLIFYNNAFVSIFNLKQSWLDTKPNYTEILEKMRENHKLPEQADFRKFKEKQISLFNNLIDTHNEFHYLPDGTALRVAIIPGPRGELLFSHEDITDKITLEQSYNTAIAVSKTTINNLHEAIAVYGEDGRLKLFNPSLQKMWNIDECYLKTMPHISDVLLATKKEYHTENWKEFCPEETLAIINKIKGEKNFRLKNGKYINRNINLLPDGAVLVTYHEVTATKLLEKSLRDKNSMLTELTNLKSNLFSSISYELRSPLTSIIGFTEIILMFHSKTIDQKSLQYINDIYQSAQGLSQIIDNMLDFSSIKSGVVDLNKEETSITEIIDLLKEEKNSPVYKNSKISILYNTNGPKKVEVNKQLIVKGFVHLIRYAIQILGKIKIIEFVDHDLSSQEKNQNNGHIGLLITISNKLTKNNNEEVVQNHDDITNINLTIIKKFITWHGGSLNVCHTGKQTITFICLLPEYKDKKIKV